LTFNKTWGEAVSLNPVARDYMLKLAKLEKDRLPLGEPLAYPHDEDVETKRTALLDLERGESDAVEWKVKTEEATDSES
jgi:hypothetical protein